MSGESKLAARLGHKAEFDYVPRYVQRGDFNPKTRELKAPNSAAEVDLWQPGRRTSLSVPFVGEVPHHTSVSPEIVFVAEKDPAPRKDGTQVFNHRDHWIYVLHQTPAGAEFFLELFTGEGGEPQVNELNPENRLDWQPNTSPETPSPHIADRVAGEDWSAYILGIPFRLSEKGLDFLTQNIDKWVKPISLSQHLEWVSEKTRHGVIPATDRIFSLPALFPFSVAANLARDIRRFRAKRNILLGVGGEGKLDEETLRRHREDLLEHTLCRAMSHWLGDDDIRSDIKSHLKGDADDVQDHVNDVVSDYETKIAKLNTRAEATAFDLAAWFNRELVQGLIDGCELGFESQLTLALARFVPVMGESAPGLAAVNDHIKGQKADSLFAELFVKTASTARRDYAAGGSKVVKAALGIGKVVTKLKIRALNKDTFALAMGLHDHFKIVFPDVRGGFTAQQEAIKAWVQTSPKTPIGASRVKAAKRLEITATRFTADLDNIKKLDNAIGTVGATMKILDAFGVYVACLEYVNTVENDPDLKFERGAKAAASTVSLLSSLVEFAVTRPGMTTRLAAKLALRSVGVVADGVLIFYSFRKAGNLGTRGDVDAQILTFGAASCAAVGVSGSLITTISAGAASTFNPWLAAIALLGLALGVLAEYCTDSDLQTLVRGFGISSGYRSLLKSRERHRIAAEAFAWPRMAARVHDRIGCAIETSTRSSLASRPRGSFGTSMCASKRARSRSCSGSTRT